MERDIRILILTSKTSANVYLVNQLLQRFDVAGLVVESPPLAVTREEKWRRRRRLFRRYGFFRALNKLLFSKLRGRLGGSGSQDESPFGEENRGYVRPVPALEVENINDPDCVEWIRRLAPDLLAVCGTTVLKRDVFSLAPLGALNIHTGITPEFRSADPIFWAIYCGQPDKVGVTIHYIDAGIDTGPIVFQERVPVYNTDTLESIHARCIRHGAALYVRAVEAVRAGTIRTLDRSDVAGRAFYSIDLGLVQYLIFRRRFRRLKRGLPPPPAAGESLGPEDGR